MGLGRDERTDANMLILMLHEKSLSLSLPQTAMKLSQANTRKSFVSIPGVLCLLQVSMKLWQANTLPLK